MELLYEVFLGGLMVRCFNILILWIFSDTLWMLTRGSGLVGLAGPPEKVWAGLRLANNAISSPKDAKK